MINRTNMFLSVLLVVVVILTATSRVDHARPNIEILPDMMKYSPAFHTYEANRNFANKRTLQAPVPGTIARGDMPLYYEATPEDAVRAGEELLNPYGQSEASHASAEETGDVVPGGSSDDEQADQESAVRERRQESVQRGGEVYGVFCQSCHGPSGAGDGPVAKRGFPPPPSLLTGKSLQMKDGQLFHILTYGQGNMSPFAAQLARMRRWDVINHLRSLQANAPPAVALPEGTVSNSDPNATVGEEPVEAPAQPESKGRDDAQ